MYDLKNDRMFFIMIITVLMPALSHKLNSEITRKWSLPWNKSATRGLKGLIKMNLGMIWKQALCNKHET